MVAAKTWPRAGFPILAELSLLFKTQLRLSVPDDRAFHPIFRFGWSNTLRCAYAILRAAAPQQSRPRSRTKVEVTGKKKEIQVGPDGKALDHEE